MKTVLRFIWLPVLASYLCVTAQATEARTPLPGHIPPQLRSAARLGSVPDDETVELGLVMQLDPTLLTQTLSALYGPKASRPKHFLDSREFAERFGLAAKRQKLREFAMAQGLHVDSDDRPESLVVKVSGPAGRINQALGVRLDRYRSAQGRVFRTAAAAPLVPESLVPELAAVIGLSDLGGLAHPQIRLRPRAPTSGVVRPANSGVRPTAITGATGPSGGLAPQDIKTIYGLGSTPLNGTGQTAAVFELDGYNPADISAYLTHFALPPLTVSPVSVDGFPNLCAGQSCATQDPNFDTDMVEVALDIEMVAALSPNLSKLLVYEDTNTAQGVFDLYDRIATDNSAKIVSTSWALSEVDVGSAFVQAENQVFQRMAIQGQSVYAAAGDQGAYNGLSVPNVTDPASQPYVTGVGGTTLSGSLGSPIETVWNNGPSEATGGGVSAFWSRPDYQAGIAGVASTQFRNVPDVALNADPNTGYSVYVGGGSVNGGWFAVGGTSAAAPLWAGFTALLNQRSMTLGNGVLGFANPLLYQQATSSAYAQIFTDVTTGTNNLYNAGPGYDNTTGWGSFKGSSLISSINGQLATIIRNNLLQSLANVYAYPNPWDVRKSPPAGVTLANVPDGATIKIFTLSGFHVADLTAANGSATWDLKNTAGQAVASDLYLYFVSFGGKTFRGKIAVIK